MKMEKEEDLGFLARRFALDCSVNPATHRACLNHHFGSTLLALEASLNTWVHLAVHHISSIELVQLTSLFLEVVDRHCNPTRDPSPLLESLL